MHGLWESPFLLKVLGSKLKKAAYDIQYFNYSSVNSGLEENTEKLFYFLQALASDDLYLVGHSLGGLVILELLEKYPVLTVQSSVIFGAPVNGSSVARVFGQSYFGNKMMGDSYTALCNGVRLLRDHKVGVVAGTGGKGLGQFLTNLQKPHDGVVAVSETILLGAIDSICLPKSHFTLLLSTDLAAEIIVFFESGKFRSGISQKYI